MKALLLKTGDHLMRTLATRFTRHIPDRIAPPLIGLGVVMLLMQLCWPLLPVATAVALIALGATFANIARRHRSVSLRAALAVHLFIYISLYLLFIGAICDAAMRGQQDGLSLLQTIDLGLSAGVMALVVRACVVFIIGGGDAPAR
ncbi:MAG: hypothetical protein L0228_13010 [Planctomycetes bacterium]|nr:hypothetical protein [Planctomycetota bacterium]